jgi:hypothetical protein
LGQWDWKSDWFRSLAERLSSHGLDSMLVWVLSENPYRRLYETLRGQYLVSQTVQFGKVNYQEISYAWIDIRDLI